MSMLFKRFKDWATTITAFRTGDYIAVDGTDTAKMSKDSLLEITKENAQDGLLPACFTSDIYTKTHPAIGVVLGVYIYDVDPNLETLSININDTTIYAFKKVSGTSSNNNFTIDNSGIQFISISAYKAVILYDVTRLGGGLTFGTGLLNLNACQNTYASMKAFFAANYGKVAPKQVFPSFFTDSIATMNNPAVGIIKEVYIKSADAGLETLNINIDRDKIYVFKKISGTSTNNIVNIDSSGIVEVNVTGLDIVVVYDKSKMKAGETYRTGLLDIDSCKNAYNSPSAFLYSSFGNQNTFLKQRDGIASLFVGDITLADVDTIGFYVSGNVSGRTITDKPPMWSGETFFYFIVFHRLCKVLVDDAGGIYWYINDTWITGGIDGVWVRLGDSITKGTYSAGGASAVDDRKSYQFIANKWRFRKQMVNLGVGGMGWRRKTGDTNKCAKDVVDDIGSTYNGAIISLAFGVNDWIFGGVLGTSSDAMDANTIFGAIRYCIYNVITNNPKSQVFVVAPMNCWSNSAPAPDYAYGTANSNGVTLLDIKNAMKTICEEYGVMFIDFGGSVINKLNITTQLNDTVHPTQTAHVELAREACNKFPCW